MLKKELGFSHVFLPLIIVVIVIVIIAGRNVYKSTGDSGFFSGTPVEVTQLTSAHLDFGIDLLKDVAKGIDQENHIISPTNISIAMSMLYSGADGETQTALQEGMRFGDLSIYEVNSQTQSLISTLQEDSDQELRIANSLWAVNNFEPMPSFVDVIKQYFDSTVDTGSVEKINNWASENTNGKIPTIINEIPENLRLLITSALYFNGTWKTEFNQSNTDQRQFTNRVGNKQDTETMFLNTEMDYIEADNFQAASLPYGENEDFKMLIILPDDMDAYLDEYDSSMYKQIVGSVEKQDGTLYLPKFKQKLSYDLNGNLKSLGMDKIFQERNELKAIGEGLFVGFVKHEVFMDVNESGTEAAAITSIGAVTTSAGPVDEEVPFVMDVNKPFLISLYHSKTGESLFMGIINDPSLDPGL